MLGRTPLRASRHMNRNMPTNENVIGNGKNFVPISVRFEEFKRKKEAASKKRPAAETKLNKTKKRRRKSNNQTSSTLFEGKAKLYSYQGHVWSPMGTGNVAIVENNALNQLTLEMRDEKTSEIDHQFKCGSEPLKSNGPKSWLFSGSMIVQNQSARQEEKSFAVRFFSDQTAKRFKSVFQEAQEHNAKVGNEGEQTTPVKKEPKIKKTTQSFQSFLESRKRALSDETETSSKAACGIGWSIDMTQDNNSSTTTKKDSTMTTQQKKMTVFPESQVTEMDRTSHERVLKSFHTKGMSKLSKVKRTHLEGFLHKEGLNCVGCANEFVVTRVRKLLQKKYSMTQWNEMSNSIDDVESASEEEEEEEEEQEEEVQKEEEHDSQMNVSTTTEASTTQQGEEAVDVAVDVETPVVSRTSSVSLEDTIEKIKNTNDEASPIVKFGEKHKDLRRRIREKLSSKRSRESSFTSNELEQEFDRVAKKFRSSEIETEKKDEWKSYCEELREHAQRSIESMRAFEEKLSKAAEF